jgi:trans-L-3-hydroxyproline dehydratase
MPGTDTASGEASGRLRVVDMHTAGEPVRIIVDGYPRLLGHTILDKRREARERHDRIRTMVMLEPRGHAEMYGVIPVAPTAPSADLAVLFMHNEGYSTMCGHATIAMGRFAVERGLVVIDKPVTRFGLECPCGVVQVDVQVGADGRAGGVTFDSVPAFVASRDLDIDVPRLGRVRVDIAYGGAFYAILPASRIGLALIGGDIAALRGAAVAITEAIRAAIPIVHPSEPDLGFLYGTILIDDTPCESERPSANLCVFGDGQIDRSPTGSGVTARMALDHEAGRIAPRHQRRFASATGECFTGEIVETSTTAGLNCVTVRVGGRAYFTGETTFVIEDSDPLRDGFALHRFASPR